MNTPSKGAWLCRLVRGSSAVIIAFAAAACVEDSDDITALSMSKAEVWQTVSGNMAAVDPAYELTPMPPATSMRFQQSGCATSPTTLMPSGPPWRYREEQLLRDPPTARVAVIRGGIDHLRARGFTLRQQVPTSDPRDVVVEDGAGFAVGLHHTVYSSGNENVTVTSTSPCVRHPEDAAH